MGFTSLSLQLQRSALETWCQVRNDKWKKKTFSHWCSITQSACKGLGVAQCRLLLLCSNVTASCELVNQTPISFHSVCMNNAPISIHCHPTSFCVRTRIFSRVQRQKLTPFVQSARNAVTYNCPEALNWLTQEWQRRQRWHSAAATCSSDKSCLNCQHFLGIFHQINPISFSSYASQPSRCAAFFVEWHQANRITCCGARCIY